MRYFFISDVHGNYDKMIEALDANHFDKEKDTIVSVGDPFDRGPQSKEVLEYLMSCPNRILLWGNHDRRLYDLVYQRAFYNYADYQNGILETFYSFCKSHLLLFEEYTEFLRKDKMLTKYFNECCFAIEFKDLIATHAWLPVASYESCGRTEYVVNPKWRNFNAKQWDDALWSNSEIFAQLEIFPEKTLLIGHWHTWRFREKIDKKKMIDKAQNIIDSSTYTIADKLIAIDGCASYDKGGQVNVYIYQSDEDPIKYPVYQK